MAAGDWCGAPRGSVDRLTQRGGLGLRSTVDRSLNPKGYLIVAVHSRSNDAGGTGRTPAATGHLRRTCHCRRRTEHGGGRREGARDFHDRNKLHENEVHMLADSMEHNSWAENASEHGSHGGAMAGGQELVDTAL